MKSTLASLYRYVMATTLVMTAMLQWAHATDYYVDAVAGLDSNLGSSAAPWKTLARVDAASFLPGDRILFHIGQTFRGGFTMKSSGTAAAPIVISYYGDGSRPTFVNPNRDKIDGNSIRVAASYVVIDSLVFAHTPNAADNSDAQVFLTGAIYIAKGSTYVTVKNSEFIDCPIGIHIYGRHCLVTQNYLHDSKRFLSNPNWGPVSIFFNAGDNEASFNRISHYYHVGGSFGADGGAFEFDFDGTENRDNNSIHDNVTDHNMGFLEISVAPTSVKNLHVYNNVSHDYQEFIFFWQPCPGAVIENNTVDRTLPGLGQQIECVFYVFKSHLVTFQNNIFYLGQGLSVFDGETVQNHNHNLYFSADGSTLDPIGVAPGPGDMIGDPLFFSQVQSDYRLTGLSPAIDAGIAVNLPLDADGNPRPVGQGTDIGAYEFQGPFPTGGRLNLTASTPPARSVVDLTAHGTLDWLDWGYGGLKPVRKDGGNFLRGFTLVGKPAAPQTYGDNPTGFSWTDGALVPAVSKATTGLYVSGLGNGYQFSLPASPTPRTVTFYLGGYSSGGTFKASLADGSARPVLSTFTGTAGRAYNRAYTLDYYAATPTQLKVQWVQSADFNGGNVTLQAATAAPGKR